MLHHTPIVVISGPSMFWGVKKKNKNIFLEVTKKKNSSIVISVICKRETDVTFFRMERI